MPQVACVQMKVSVSDYLTSDAFYRKIERLVLAARRQSSQEHLLIAFPEHVGTFCVFCDEQFDPLSSTTLADVSKGLIKRYFLPTLSLRIIRRVGWMRALALLKGDKVARIYFDTFSSLAKQSNSWILAGSVLLPSENRRDVYNVSYLFDPDGKVMANQTKVHLVEMESASGLDVTPGRLGQLQAIDTPFGRLGIAVCLDAFKVDVRERLASLGAEVLIQPSANPGPWNEWQQQDWLTGAYQAVMEEGLFSTAVNPMLVGALLDVGFEGQSSVVSRNSSGQTTGYLEVPNKQGFVRVAKEPVAEEILLCDLNQ